MKKIITTPEFVNNGDKQNSMQKMASQIFFPGPVINNPIPVIKNEQKKTLNNINVTSMRDYSSCYSPLNQNIPSVAYFSQTNTPMTHNLNFKEPNGKTPGKTNYSMGILDIPEPITGRKSQDSFNFNFK